jgi:4-hydroxy-2-oxoheptanedioate aldolase
MTKLLMGKNRVHKINFLKDKLESGKVVVGTWSVIPSPVVADILSSAGMDFIVIDAEHGPVTYETAQNMVMACENNGCSPLFRVGSNDDNLVLRALEIGSHGVIIPQIESFEEAKRASSSMRYFPMGNRGYSPFTRAGTYSPVEEHTSISNSRVLSTIIVEGQRGMDNFHRILEVEDIDIIYLGPYDLSQSLGCPGDIENPKVLNLIEKCCKAAESRNIVIGSFVKDSQYARFLINNGVRLLAYRADCDLLYTASKKAIDDMARLLELA